MKRNVDRRSFLTDAGLVVAAGLTNLPALAQSGKGEVVIANWGGSWNDRTIKFIEAPLLEAAGIKVVRDLAAAPARRTKLLAERALPRATIDVAQFSESDAHLLFTQGVWDTLDETKVPNLKFVYDNLKTSYFVPWQYSGWVLVHNPSKVAEPPRKFADLLNPKYAGKMGLTDIHYALHIRAAALAAGGGVHDIALGQKWLLELKKAVQPRLYPGHEQVQIALKNEEVWISTNFRSRALQFGHEGAPVVPQYPGEGGIGVVFGAGVTKRARNKDNAYAYLNAMLDPKAMGGLVQETFYAPAIKNAQLPAEVKARLEFTAEEQKRLHFPDLAKAGPEDPALLDWWNKVYKA